MVDLLHQQPGTPIGRAELAGGRRDDPDSLIASSNPDLAGADAVTAREVGDDAGEGSQPWVHCAGNRMNQTPPRTRALRREPRARRVRPFPGKPDRDSRQQLKISGVVPSAYFIMQQGPGPANGPEHCPSRRTTPATLMLSFYAAHLQMTESRPILISIVTRSASILSDATF